MFGFYVIKTLWNATAVAFLCATCTKPASQKWFSGIYLSCFSELAIKFTNIIKTIFLIGESSTCPLNKPAYIRPTQSTQSANTDVYLWKQSHNRLLPRLCNEIGLLVAAAQHNGWLVDIAQWLPKYGSKPKEGWRRVKKWITQRRSKPEF